TGAHYSFKSAMDLSLPMTVSARFLKADEEHWFRLAAKKGERFSIACAPAPRASPAVPVLTIVDSGGTALTTASGATSPGRALEIEWQAPADGVFGLRLRDLQQGAGGGPEYVYRLTVHPAQSGFSLRLETDYVNVVQEGKAELDLVIGRSGGFTR